MSGYFEDARSESSEVEVSGVLSEADGRERGGNRQGVAPGRLEDSTVNVTGQVDSERRSTVARRNDVRSVLDDSRLIFPPGFERAKRVAT